MDLQPARQESSSFSFDTYWVGFEYAYYRVEEDVQASNEANGRVVMEYRTLLLDVNLETLSIPWSSSVSVLYLVFL